MVEDGDCVSPTLNEDDEVVASLLALRMMAADVAVDRASSRRSAKITACAAAADDLIERLSAVPADVAEWRLYLAVGLNNASTPDRKRAVLDRAARVACRHVASRERQLGVLIELVLHSPWPEGNGWVEKARRRTLISIIEEFDAVDAGDLRVVENARSSAVRALRRRRPVNKKKVAAVGVVSVGVGVATLGAAAPAIGAAVGGAMLGLSGAAATSAGLALLGGGSLAAGGFGMAGGTVLLAGVGGLAGAGLSFGGARLATLFWGELALDVIRLEMHTVIVTVGERRDDEQARKVAVLLQRRLEEVVVRLGEIAGQLKQVREENAAQREELERERERATVAEDALRWALERLRESGIDVGTEVLDIEGAATEGTSSGRGSTRRDDTDPDDESTWDAA